MDDAKTCSKCGKDKPLVDFGKRKDGKDGRHAVCNPCRAKWKREWRKNNPREAARGREYRVRNKGRIKEYTGKWRRRNKPLVQTYGKRNRLKHPAAHRRRHRKAILKQYGLDFEAYEAMLLKQSGLCAMCESVGPLCIDHDHATGEVRGLLCRRCNLLLGFAHDDIELLSMAVTYLRK